VSPGAKRTVRDEVTEISAQGERLTVDDEIDALRVVMARLLLEEEDLTKLVSGVSRLTTAIVQAARLQRMIAGLPHGLPPSPPPDPLTAAIERAWRQFGEPEAAARDDPDRGWNDG
jgi:hypothetical protein